jgi:hypothetical protein
MQPDDRIRLEHMIEAGETIATFVGGRIVYENRPARPTASAPPAR